MKPKSMVAMEEGQARVVGGEIHFGFLVAAWHEDIFHDATGVLDDHAHSVRAIIVIKNTQREIRHSVTATQT